MNPTMRITIILGLAWATMGGVVSAQAPAAPKGAAAEAMSLHHLHMSMLDHGLGMAAEGSNLVMLSEMGMAAEFNPTTRAHTAKRCSSAARRSSSARSVGRR